MSSRQQQKMTPEHGLSMLPLLSPLLLSTAAPSAAAMSRHAPSERAAHSPAPPGGTPMLYSKVRHTVIKQHTRMSKNRLQRSV